MDFNIKTSIVPAAKAMDPKSTSEMLKDAKKLEEINTTKQRLMQHAEQVDEERKLASAPADATASKPKKKILRILDPRTDTPFQVPTPNPGNTGSFQMKGFEQCLAEIDENEKRELEDRDGYYEDGDDRDYYYSQQNGRWDDCCDDDDEDNGKLYGEFDDWEDYYDSIYN